jgi:hypothetical protein
VVALNILNEARQNRSDSCWAAPFASLNMAQVADGFRQFTLGWMSRLQMRDCDYYRIHWVTMTNIILTTYFK